MRLLAVLALLAACTLHVEMDVRSVPAAIASARAYTSPEQHVVVPADAGYAVVTGILTLNGDAGMTTNLSAVCEDPTGSLFGCFSDAREELDAFGVRRAYGRRPRYDGCHWDCVWEPVP